MHVTRRFLDEERSARLIGIQRGSIGTYSATAVCGGSVDYVRCLGRASEPAVVAPVRAARPGELDEARITGTEERDWIPGTAQDQFRADFLRRLRADFDAFLAEQAQASDSFNLTRPKGLRTGPRAENKPASSTPRPARARKIKPMPAPTTVDGKRRAKMSLAEYAAMERALGYGSI